VARPLIHPRIFERLYNFYPSEVTIQEATEPQDTYGAFSQIWANKVGYVDLDCRLAPSGGQEVKKPDQTYVVSTHTIAIAGYYPGIDEKNRAVIGANIFDILLVENDGQGDSTRLIVEIVEQKA
jgi:hypothetical protein